MSGKYRYYRCRGAVPTATRGKICDAGYIKANELETEVWNKVIDMMTNPLTLLNKMTNEKQKQPDKVVLLLNKQIDQLRKKLKSYPTKEKNLYDLMNHEAVTKDYVLESINKLKQERLSDEHQLKSLLNYRRQLTHTPNLSISLSDMFGKAWNTLFTEHLDYEVVYPENGYPYGVPVPPDDLLMKKRALLESIRLKVLADPTGFKFSFTLDGNIISSTQADELSSFERDLRRYEEANSYVPVKKLLDPNKPLTEDTHLAEVINEAKNNLVTIEQTSG